MNDIKIDTAQVSMNIDTSNVFMKIEKTDIMSEYSYLSQFHLDQEDKEVKHDIPNQTT